MNKRKWNAFAFAFEFSVACENGRHGSSPNAFAGSQLKMHLYGRNGCTGATILNGTIVWTVQLPPKYPYTVPADHIEHILNRRCREHIRLPEVPGGIFNAIYLVNLNSAIIFCWKLKIANWKFTNNNNQKSGMFEWKSSCVSHTMHRHKGMVVCECVSARAYTHKRRIIRMEGWMGIFRPFNANQCCQFNWISIKSQNQWMLVFKIYDARASTYSLTSILNSTMGSFIKQIDMCTQSFRRRTHSRSNQTQ